MAIEYIIYMIPNSAQYSQSICTIAFQLLVMALTHFCALSAVVVAMLVVDPPSMQSKYILLKLLHTPATGKEKAKNQCNSPTQ